MSTATITPTLAKNEVHNYGTSEMSDVLGHEVCDAVRGLEKVRAMAHALAEALPDEPEDKTDPDKVQELTSRTLDVWREVKTLTANGEVAEEPSMEQINLEVLALTFEADDPERLEKTAASAVEAAGRLLSFHGQALLTAYRSPPCNAATPGEAKKPTHYQQSLTLPRKPTSAVTTASADISPSTIWTGTRKNSCPTATPTMSRPPPYWTNCVQARCL